MHTQFFPHRCPLVDNYCGQLCGQCGKLRVFNSYLAFQFSPAPYLLNEYFREYPPSPKHKTQVTATGSAGKKPLKIGAMVLFCHLLPHTDALSSARVCEIFVNY